MRPFPQSCHTHYLQYLNARPPFGSMPAVDMRRPDWEGLRTLLGHDEMRFVNLEVAELPGLVSMGFGRLRSLSLRGLNAKDLTNLEGFPHLENLEVWQSGEVTSLAPLSALDRLRELFLSGGVWKRQKLSGDFRPLAELRNLQRLTITNIRGPEDFTPLLTFRRLEHLFVATALFPIPEIARLAARYPFRHRQRPWLQPVNAGSDGCAQCGGARKLLLLPHTSEITA